MLKPSWFKVPLSDPHAMKIHRMLDDLELHTVCREARCPNIGECFNRGTATFLILGDTCTRHCAFCAISSGKIPLPPDPMEPSRVAEAVKKLGLKHCVVTGVNRDDLPLGGAEYYAETVRRIRELCTQTMVEILPGDFGAEEGAVEAILEHPPDVFNHNVETVERLTPLIRDHKADYRTSLRLLRMVKDRKPDILTKSGIIVGLGEKRAEISQTMKDLREVGCDGITIGQYIAPSAKHAPVVKYYSPEEFAALELEARSLGFTGVAAGPLVRSSYKAGGMFPAEERV